MNILLYDLGSYTQKDIIYYLEQAGCHCMNILYSLKDPYEDAFFERRFSQYLQGTHWDCVMSTNFFPIVARLCYDYRIKYISWIYDSPINPDYTDYFGYPTNYIFHFDRMETDRLQKCGITNIYHLPLAASPRKLQCTKLLQSDYDKYAADVSFVGQFYDSPLHQLMYYQEEYDKGYVDAIVQTQLRVYGYNFITEMVTPDLVDRINAHIATQSDNNLQLTVHGLVQSITKQVTHTERIVLCNLLGQMHHMRYYSNTCPPELSHLSYGGTAYYHTEMPKIFRLSKLNLNPTLRSIQSGIPLRALDILSCRGTLFSNYQPELAEYFTDGIDAILYESLEDAVAKADFYLRKDFLREQISQNGYEKALTLFSYPDRIQTMLHTAGLF